MEGKPGLGEGARGLKLKPPWTWSATGSYRSIAFYTALQCYWSERMSPVSLRTSISQVEFCSKQGEEMKAISRIWSRGCWAHTSRCESRPHQTDLSVRARSASNSHDWCRHMARIRLTLITAAPFTQPGPVSCSDKTHPTSNLPNLACDFLSVHSQITC